MKRCRLLLIIIFASLCACGGNDDSPPAPTIATLVFPEENSECTSGVSINITESRVAFSWTASANTDTYKLDITNLDSGTTESYGTNDTSFEVNLIKGAPYSWSVTSRANNSSQTAQSEVWRFYNAGEGISSYAPFPATAVYPEVGATVFPPEGRVILQWSGADVDNDISGYAIYLDVVHPPEATIGNSINSETFQASGLLPATVYYWRIVTTDIAGNTSNSEVFQFITTE